MILTNFMNKMMFNAGLIKNKDIDIIKTLMFDKNIDIRPAVNGLGGYPGKFELRYGRVTKLRISNLHDRNKGGLDNEVFELISNLPCLEKLAITASNSVNDIPDCLHKLTRLEELSINFQSMPCFPLAITNIKNLKYLGLWSDSIENIPNEIGNLSYLRTLQMQENNVKKIPDSIEKLKSLEGLSLSNNKVSEINPKLYNLPNLQSVDLSNNQISEIPSGISKLINLKQISFANHKWHEEFNKTSIIENADYGINTISFIPNDLKYLRNLELLMLDNNPILKNIKHLERYNKMKVSNKIDYLLEYQKGFLQDYKEQVFNDIQYTLSPEDSQILKELLEESKKNNSKDKEFLEKLENFNTFYNFGDNVLKFTKIIRTLVGLP